ncbi:MAG TPA: trypsin-like serine protease [Candidatus Baltobacteraceae bacterium]|nr:trypsin-like serine protease [Candidatus Baltobacteraceae bacterium]
MRVLVTIAMFCCAATVLAGCGGGTTSLPAGGSPGSQIAYHPSLNASATVPAAFRCLPSGLPTGAGYRPSLAYMSHCAVADAPEAATLQKLAVALMAQGSGSFSEYCTGTPLYYDAATNVGFVVTAAHCVVGNHKAADSAVTPKNITTFASGNDWIYQGTPGIVSGSAELTGQIQAVYVPSQYCYAPAFNASGCSDLARQNGDVAVVKVTGNGSRALEVDHRLRLAPANAVLQHASEIMALGYGTNTSSTPDDRVLYYITYRYYANDAFDGASSELSLMNGYHHNGNFYSIICQGDSGGGDFYWDGTHWNLVGAHSWGPTPCGVWGSHYTTGYDVSADTRSFDRWIHLIVRDDVKPTGCASLGSSYVCKAR